MDIMNALLLTHAVYIAMAAVIVIKLRKLKKEIKELDKKIGGAD